MIEAEKNASSYITEEKPEFPDDLTDITVFSDGTAVEELKNATVAECASVDGRYWFALHEISNEEMESEKIKSNIEYIAMMTGVDLEE